MTAGPTPGETRLALLRHAPTAWNRLGRVQGRADPPLDAAARHRLCGCRLPANFAGFGWRVSPLRRTRETAALLGLGDARIEPRLIEMRWGEWEGETLAALRHRLGPAMAANEARGLDFQPPGGESPRQLQQRLRPLLAEIGQAGEATGLITHKGVIRAVLAGATGWAMLGRPPVRLDWMALHLFAVDAAGAARPLRFNIPLVPAP